MIFFDQILLTFTFLHRLCIGMQMHNFSDLYRLALFEMCILIQAKAL